MINNYYTLKYIANDLNQKIQGYDIVEVFTQFKNELLISLSKEGSAFTLQISIDPANCFMLLRDQIKKAKTNSLNLFPDMIEESINKVSINPTDRIIRISFHSEKALYITFFRGESNIYYVNEENQILHSFKDDKSKAGKGFLVDKRDFSLEKYLLSSEDLRKELRRIKEKNITRILTKLLPILGTVISKEILFRANISTDNDISELSNIDLDLIWHKLKEIYGELMNPNPQIYYDNERPFEFSIIDLRHLNKYEKRNFTDIQESISAFLFARKGFRTRQKEKDDLTKKIDNELLFLNSSVQKLEKELNTNRSEEYQKTGDLLMSNLEKVVSGAELVQIKDEQNGIDAIVTLDPSLSPVQNASLYFEKSKKAREARKISEKRLDDTRLRYNILKDIFEELKNCKDREEFKPVLAKYKKELENYGITDTEEQQKELSLFRKFVVDGGFEVLCGKNSENNDILTLKYAKPYDLWFHARGSGGSHVVLKIDSGKGEPSKKAISQAGSIAAYYSQAKGSSTVPVAMTQKKYVRKPKGANPGTVTLQQEKVIFVEPKLPL